MAPRKKSELVTLREQLEVEELKVRLGSIKQLSESINVGNNFIPPQDIYPTGDGFGTMPGILGALSSVDRNARGDLPEAYLSEQQLTWARKRSRWLGISNEYARNALSNRQNYIVGQGFQVSPVAREADDVLDPTLEKLLQDFIEEFSAVNQWGLMQREAVLRGDRDGDGAIRLFPQSDGMTRLRFVESDFIKDATGQYSYGIETAPDDVADPLAYWVTYPGQEPVRISADEVVFFKLNTDSGVKRGLPFLYPIFELLNQIEKINLNTGLLIAIQSSYAVIKKTPGASQSSLNTARSANASFTGSNPLTGQTDYYSQVRGGKIIETTPANEYEFPAAGVSVPGFVAGRQALLQTAAAGVGMAEYMLTSDASNGNFSSTMVSESPPLKGFAAMQYFWQHIFGTGVYYPAANNGVLWRAIEHAVESGRLPEDVLTSVRLEVTGDSNEVRDKNQETDRMLKLEEAGVIDNDQVAKAHGYKKARVSSEDKEAKKADEMKQQLAAKSKTLKESWEEDLHPRAEDGKFASKGGEGSGSDADVYKQMKAMRKDAFGASETTQPRAKAGGEEGPNGEWYKGGAFIATTDIPKKVKEKIKKAATGKVQTSPTEWDVPAAGKMSIFSKVAGTAYNHRDRSINYTYLEYQKYSIEEVKQVEEIVRKLNAGEKWIDVNDYPWLANFSDLSRMAVTGVPIPGDAMKYMPADVKQYFSKYTASKNSA